MDLDKLKVVDDWPQPKNVKEFRGFLGIMGWYWVFIKGYAKIAASITKLLRKNAKIIWSQE